MKKEKRYDERGEKERKCRQGERGVKEKKQSKEYTRETKRGQGK